MFYIDIPKRGEHCLKGKEPLLEGNAYYSLLVPVDKSQRYKREDYCVSCWQSMVGSEEDNPLQKDKCFNGSWKATIPFKKKGSQLPKRRDERALYLLRQLLNEDVNEKKREETFVLALYLARRRLIALRQELKREDHKIFLLYEVLETEEMLFIPKVLISEIVIETVQRELAIKFNEK